MIRFATILLTLAVCFAGAYCPCAAASTMEAHAQALSAAAEHDSHVCCRPVGQRDSDRKDPAPAEHRCPHCMGTIATHQTGGKTVAAPLAPAPYAIPAFVQACLARVDFHFALLLNRTDLPPPGDACTLLDLSCSFLI